MTSSYADLVSAGYGPYMAGLVQDEGYDGNEAILAARAKQAFDQVHNLALAIAAATKAGDTAAAAGLRSQITYWLGELRAAEQAAGAADAPAPVLQTLSDFSDAAIQIAKSVGAGVGNVVGALPDLLKKLPVLLALVLGILIVVFLFKRRG